MRANAPTQPTLRFTLPSSCFATSIPAAPRSPSKSNPTARIAAGDIVLANRCGYIDVLLHAARLAPVFGIAGTDGSLRLVSTWQALRAAASPAPAPSSLTRRDPAVSPRVSVREAIVRVARGGGGPLVVFPESAPTNNRAITVFSPLAAMIADVVVDIAKGRDADTAHVRVPITHILAVRYSSTPITCAGRPATAGSGSLVAASPAAAPSGAFSVPLVCGDAVQHALTLAQQARASAMVLRLPAGFDPQPADFFAAPASGGTGTGPGASDGVGGSSVAAAASSTSSGWGRPTAAAPATAASPAADAAAPAGPATWPAAVSDALVQLLRGVRAVALGHAEYARFCAMVAEAPSAISGGKAKAV